MMFFAKIVANTNSLKLKIAVNIIPIQKYQQAFYVAFNIIYNNEIPIKTNMLSFLANTKVRDSCSCLQIYAKQF